MPELQFSTFSEFLAMGGYGLYVWSAYFIFAVVVAYNLFQPRWTKKKLIKQQAARQQRQHR